LQSFVKKGCRSRKYEVLKRRKKRVQPSFPVFGNCKSTLRCPFQNPKLVPFATKNKVEHQFHSKKITHFIAKYVQEKNEGN